eukprot:711695-Amphidinium_carterae.7
MCIRDSFLLRIKLIQGCMSSDMRQRNVPARVGNVRDKGEKAASVAGKSSAEEKALGVMS